jgi:hypothetical protein
VPFLRSREVIHRWPPTFFDPIERATRPGRLRLDPRRSSRSYSSTDVSTIRIGTGANGTGGGYQLARVTRRAVEGPITRHISGRSSSDTTKTWMQSSSSVFASLRPISISPKEKNATVSGLESRQVFGNWSFPTRGSLRSCRSATPPFWSGCSKRWRAKPRSNCLDYVWLAFDHGAFVRPCDRFSVLVIACAFPCPPSKSLTIYIAINVTENRTVTMRVADSLRFRHP